MNRLGVGLLAVALAGACSDDGGDSGGRDQFMIGDVGPEMAAPPAMDMGRFPQACVDLVMRSVACGIVPGGDAAASLEVCANSDPALRAERADCVSAAPDCDGVLACLTAPTPDATVDAGSADGGLLDASPPDRGVDADVDAGPDAQPDLAIADMIPPDAGPPPGACPAEWGATPLEAQGDGYGAVGSTEGAPVQAGPASCGGGAGDRTYRFTPPTPGRWRFETFSDALDVDTVLSVRGDCARADRELACNDDAAADQFTSRVELELAAGVPVWVVVDGLTNPDEGYAWQGPFRLSVTPVED